VSFAMIPYWHQEFQTAVIETAHCQASLDQALIACGLEEWRQSHGSYPENLDSLSASLPHDVITGQAYKYRTLPDDRFIPYSSGWNEIDDSGRPSIDQSDGRSQNLGNGDWVWQYPNR